LELLVVSSDGTLLFVAFDAAEVGVPLPPSAVLELRREKFGDVAAVNAFAESSTQLQRTTTVCRHLQHSL
jgi:hypothetical protein